TPGKIIVLYGDRIGPSSLATAQVAGNGRLATTLGGTQVLFDGVPAPLLYSSAGQVAAGGPYAGDRKTRTQVPVKNGSPSTDPRAGPGTPSGPAAFPLNRPGQGPAAVRNRDGLTVTSSKAPAARGSVISIYATGEGQTDPAGADGALATGPVLPKPKLPVK